MTEGEYIINMSNHLRGELKKIENRTRDILLKTITSSNSELPANTMLCIRHIEDARMRLGKVIQHCGDGISIYDKNDAGK